MSDDKPAKAIAIAFPAAESQRRLLKDIAPMPIPARYREGAENRPCTLCKMELNVGPRVLAAGLDVYCPVCARFTVEELRLQREDEAPVHNLGNPESHDEPTDAELLRRVIVRAKELAFCGEQADAELAVNGVVLALERLDKIEPSRVRSRELGVINTFDLVGMLPDHDPATCVNGLTHRCPKCAAWQLKDIMGTEPYGR